ncbi:FtsX-like permease family protein [Candidatus Uhrbacteria bacterium]|nr:FtsX-like permease family protein [Candidatus Uhrbacteria bacterium]
MRTIARIMKFTFQSFWRNMWLSLVTLTIFVLTLMTVNAVLLVNVVTGSAIRAVEEEVQVAVYFVPGTSEAVQQSARGYLLGLPQVKTIDTISADQALENFKERNANDPTVLAALEEVGGNPFGDALLISAHSPEDFAFILEAVKSPEYTEYIKEADYTDYEEVIAKLSSFADRLRIAGLALTAFFGLVSVLIIFNAIRIAIYVHRDEIAIMKLVGAHDWFVRAPFVLEAVLLSFIATGVMAGVVLLGAKTLDNPLMQYFGQASLSLWDYFTQNALIIFGGEFLALSVLSILTTAFAMRKHLRV